MGSLSQAPGYLGGSDFADASFLGNGPYLVYKTQWVRKILPAGFENGTLRWGDKFGDGRHDGSLKCSFRLRSLI